MLAMLTMLYVGGCLSVALACVAIYANPRNRQALHSKLTGRQAGGHAAALSLLWPVVFVAMAIKPSAFKFE